MIDLEPLIVASISGQPIMDGAGCYATFRRTQPGDPKRFEAEEWTCLRVASSGEENLAAVVRRELEMAPYTRATHFMAVACSPCVDLDDLTEEMIELHLPIFEH